MIHNENHEFIWTQKVMDKIWDGNASKSEVIGSCGVDKNPNVHTERTKLNAPKTEKKWSQKMSHLLKCLVSTDYDTAC